MRNYSWVFCALFVSLPSYSQSVLLLNEKVISEMSKKSSPQWDLIEATFLTTKTESEQLQDKFRPELYSDAQFSETREKALIQFQPIWSPAKTAQVGVRQALRGGVSMSAGLGFDQRSAMTPSGTFRDVSTSVLRFDFQIDLWKNLLGRLSKAEILSAEIAKERAEIERAINRKLFLVSLRKTYWALIANNEQNKVYEGLKKISVSQIADARARLKAGVTDSGEVARYEAQLASRTGSSLYYNYQREILLKQLKTLLPELQNLEINLADYSLNSMIKDVMSCTDIISSQASVPYAYTQYDEVNELIRKSQFEQNKLASSYDDIDLKFLGAVKTTGVASKSNGNNVNSGSYGAALNDWQDHNRTGYSAGLQLVIPIGKVDTRKTKELLVQKKFEAQINQNNSVLVSNHLQLMKLISLLTSAVRAQKENTEALERRLAVQNKKFREARISANDLILDQDALLNSNLIAISTQQEIVNTILDYLAIFTETPCEFNRI